MALKRASKRRALSLTSLIDVIFLLLLFFMLTSTFSKYAEIEIPGGGSATAQPTLQDRRILFLRPTPDHLLVNGKPFSVETAAQFLTEQAAERPSALLVSLNPTTTAQDLVGILALLRGIPDLPVSILESS